jgi:secondary thiamine-phosphate synthase enzyme
MFVRQWTVTLRPRPRGIHLVTNELLSEIDLAGAAAGTLQLFAQHTSAALTLNENASPEVRADLERWLSRAVPDGAPYFRHRLEGDDDMPAHVKASLCGASVSVPVTRGRLALGTWQGVYLCEFRESGGHRRVVATLLAEG